MENAADYVNSLGGTVAVAKGLKIPVSTVSSWKATNRIPEWRRPALEQLAAQQRKQASSVALDDTMT